MKNQKLSNQQIQTIKELKANGVRLSFISKLLEAEGHAKSLAYYHLSENRDGYDNKAKVIRLRQKELIRHKIAKLIDQGYTTGEISKDWNTPLAVVNKIYTGKVR